MARLPILEKVAVMSECLDRYEAMIGRDGSILVPVTLLGKLRWMAGARVLLEETDDGLLVTEIEAPGDVEDGG